jgi:hypothetical protein
VSYLQSQTNISYSRLSKKYRKVPLAPVVGVPFGSFFELVNGRLVPMKSQTRDLVPKASNTEDGVQGKDNRNLCNNSDSQKLTADEIIAMRQNGSTGRKFCFSTHHTKERRSFKLLLHPRPPTSQKPNIQRKSGLKKNKRNIIP